MLFVVGFAITLVSGYFTARHFQLWREADEETRKPTMDYRVMKLREERRQYEFSNLLLAIGGLVLGFLFIQAGV